MYERATNTQDQDTLLRLIECQGLHGYIKESMIIYAQELKYTVLNGNEKKHIVLTSSIIKTDQSTSVKKL